MKKLEQEFYLRSAILVAKDLLGKYIVKEDKNGIISGMITECEAYMGINDKASHSYKGKITKRNKTMFHEGGCAYVYMIYGMYYCINVVTEKEDVPEAVLIRAVQPLVGLDIMSNNRYGRDYEELNKKEIINLTNGPGKLCKAFDITKVNDGNDLCDGKIYISENENEEQKKLEVISAPRIGIDYAEEAKNYLWRFFIKNNIYVTKK